MNPSFPLLRIDLSQHRAREEEIDLSLILKFLGGRGLGAKILFDALKPSTDPLSAENKLLFLAGPLIGTGAPWCVKYTVMTKSPLSGTILMSLAGGYFGPGLRRSGYDGLIIEGRSEEPVYLSIINGKAEFREASHLWGMTTEQCQGAIKEELGTPRLEIACIGPAGERAVRMACVISGKRAAGRGGGGAVMGSKNLKAIAVHGERKVPIAEPEKFKELQMAIRKKVPEIDRLKVFGKYGTPKNLVLVHERGLFPNRNFQGGVFEGIDQVNHLEQQKRVIRPVTCHDCPVACGNLTQATDGSYKDITTEGPEYETFWAFGAQCGNNSIDAIIAADRLCDQLGLDTISTGNSIAFAMECVQKGLLNKEEIQDLDLRFGNHAAMVEMIRRIGYREGIGDLLGEGVRRASERIGGGAQSFAMHVKGLELAAYDPRGAKGMGIEYATSPRGGCHERGLISRETFGAPPYIDPLSIEGKGAVVKETQDETAALDALGVCVFPPHNDGMDMNDLAQLVSCTLGKSWTSEDLLETGDRIWNLERLFNLREGFTKADDTLPPRLLREPMQEGPAKGHVVELEPLLQDYYRARHWDTNGVPTPEVLDKLGLAEEGRGILARAKGDR
ncbi:MAG: aldehyde ferredoxin oxidoreductase family protein [Desulfobacteraceae bacterium]|jgi:aldehyde:ferredoxin oxidoreductase